MEHTQEIVHELNELYKLCSNQRNTRLRKSVFVVSPKQITGDQSVCALPDPVRFTRKTKPNTSKDASARSARHSESPSQSTQQSCESSTKCSDDSYDALLQRLMYDNFSFDVSVIGNLDEQLNVER
jgi:hypothetical protein